MKLIYNLFIQKLIDLIYFSVHQKIIVANFWMKEALF